MTDCLVSFNCKTGYVWWFLTRLFIIFDIKRHITFQHKFIPTWFNYWHRERILKLSRQEIGISKIKSRGIMFRLKQHDMVWAFNQHIAVWNEVLFYDILHHSKTFVLTCVKKKCFVWQNQTSLNHTFEDSWLISGLAQVPKAGTTVT